MEPAEEIESPGKYLKAKREYQRISLREVADATKIREAVLKAIEEDRYGDLPHIYVKSFLSTYAKCLGLDPTDVIMLHQKYVEKLSFSKSQVSKHPSAFPRKRVNPSTPRPEGQGLPSTRAQAEGLRVDPEPRFLTPSLKTGLGAAERVNVRLLVISISVALLIALIVYASFRLLH
jgi:transcriptional regulator with XRE-family HTH domain